MKIFYSWQSDLEANANRYFLRDCIKEAIKKVNKINGIEARIDHDTKGIGGTPDITEEIFKKIRNSQIFICGVS